MKQFTGNKPSSTAVIVTFTAIALVGFSTIAINKKVLLKTKGTSKAKDNDAEISRQIDAISAENVVLRRNIERLSTSLDEMILQNEKLITANNTLSSALEEEREIVVRLMKVISEQNEEKLGLTRKLEEADSKLSTTGFIHENSKAMEHIA